MESTSFTITSIKNPLITMEMIPGHFITNSAHSNYYLDVSELKSNVLIAKDAARELAIPYISKEQVDIIICMDGIEMIAAYLAEELSKNGTMVMNSNREIHVITPIKSTSSQLIFHQNVQEKIQDRNVILTVASASTGETIRRALDCLDYYSGNLVGISALFSTVSEIDGYDINSLFTCDDVPDYRCYLPDECAMCAENRKIDALADSEGYTEI